MLKIQREAYEILGRATNEEAYDFDREHKEIISKKTKEIEKRKGMKTGKITQNRKRKREKK